MLLAPPIVSQAYILRTKLLSFNIFLTEKARERVTANGKPYGIATTTTVIPKIAKSSIRMRSGPVCHLSFGSVAVPFTIANLIKSTITIKIAEYNPNFPISVATF
jgi:ribosomal protein L9